MVLFVGMLGCIGVLTSFTRYGDEEGNPFCLPVLFAWSGRDHGGAEACVVMCSLGSCLGAPGNSN